MVLTQEPDCKSEYRQKQEAKERISHALQKTKETIGHRAGKAAARRNAKRDVSRSRQAPLLIRLNRARR